MTPWPCTPHAAGLLLVVVLTATAPSHASYATEPRPDEPRPADSRAGSRPGEGRERPGREAAPWWDEDAGAHRPELDPGVPDAPVTPDSPEATADPDIGSDTGSDTGSDVGSEPPRDATPSPSASDKPAVAHPVGSTEPMLRILPLGSGLVLIGLGIGLALLALRVRRVRRG
ncbi:hypothetical protein FE633_32210 [Streptomyces montanus]|uniref:LPXTG cell wall anchor domain-containing protein n=1 Tax=Streptomyces montanus TaxID=2580423 RepID=A0A5R9FNS2_9ACTN|nr:hypothetical protein [Streptomyces montanus]TLS42184.1 hypothetical protein FE633_32210 [Streptomyces montanus]